MSTYIKKWKGKEIEDNFKAIRLALSECATPQEVCEFIQAASAWSPGEHEEYIGLLNTIINNENLDQEVGSKISKLYDENKVQEIQFEIKCMGNPAKMIAGYNLFIRKFSN